MRPFSLDHLSPTEFEEFCYDLLKALGFVNLNWRKGTGLSSSPSDQGRDIECQFLQKDVDGDTFLETWFVECKHYIQGVSPDKIAGALSWAQAERPDRLLIIASNFLSNPTKEHIKTHKREHRPTFKIKIWERPNLEEMASGKPALLKKYNISGGFPYVSIMHPSHLTYLISHPSNSLRYLFEQLDKLNSEARERLLSKVNRVIMRTDDLFYYETFKKKCYEIADLEEIDERILTYFITSYTLQEWLALGNTTTIDENVTELTQSLPSLKKRSEDFEPNKVDLWILGNFYKRTGKSIENKSYPDMLIEMFQNLFIETLPERVKENYSLYLYFCEQVVEKLLSERYLYD